MPVSVINTLGTGEIELQDPVCEVNQSLALYKINIQNSVHTSKRSCRKCSQKWTMWLSSETLPSRKKTAFQFW